MKDIDLRLLTRSTNMSLPIPRALANETIDQICTVSTITTRRRLTFVDIYKTGKQRQIGNEHYKRETRVKLGEETCGASLTVLAELSIPSIRTQATVGV